MSSQNVIGGFGKSTDNAFNLDVDHLQVNEGEDIYKRSDFYGPVEFHDTVNLDAKVIINADVEAKTFTATDATNQFVVRNASAFDFKVSTSVNPVFNFRDANNSLSTSTIEANIIHASQINNTQTISANTSNSLVFSSQKNSGTSSGSSAGYVAQNADNDTAGVFMQSTSGGKRGQVRSSSTAFGLDLQTDGYGTGANKSIKLYTDHTTINSDLSVLSTSNFYGAVTLNSGSALLFNGSTSGTTTLKVPDVAGSYNFILPSSTGTNGQYLTSTGGNDLVWTSPSITPTFTSLILTSTDPALNSSTGALQVAGGISVNRKSYIAPSYSIPGSGTISGVTAGLVIDRPSFTSANNVTLEYGATVHIKGPPDYLANVTPLGEATAFSLIVEDITQLDIVAVTGSIYCAGSTGVGGFTTLLGGLSVTGATTMTGSLSQSLGNVTFSGPSLQGTFSSTIQLTSINGFTLESTSFSLSSKIKTGYKLNLEGGVEVLITSPKLTTTISGATNFTTGSTLYKTTSGNFEMESFGAGSFTSRNLLAFESTTSNLTLKAHNDIAIEATTGLTMKSTSAMEISSQFTMDILAIDDFTLTAGDATHQNSNISINTTLGAISLNCQGGSVSVGTTGGDIELNAKNQAGTGGGTISLLGNKLTSEIISDIVFGTTGATSTLAFSTGGGLMTLKTKGGGIQIDSRNTALTAGGTVEIFSGAFSVKAFNAINIESTTSSLSLKTTNQPLGLYSNGGSMYLNATAGRMTLTSGIFEVFPSTSSNIQSVGQQDFKTTTYTTAPINFTTNNSNVSFTTVGGNFSVNTITSPTTGGNFNITADNASITTNNGFSSTVLAGNYTASVTTGDLAISTSVGKLDLTASAGAMNLTTTVGALNINAVAGELSLKGGVISALAIGAVSLTGGGAASLTGGGALTLSGGGATSLTGGGATTIQGGGALTLTGLAAVTMTSVGLMTITAGNIMAVTVTAGAMTIDVPLGALTCTVGGGALALTCLAGGIAMTTGLGTMNLTTGLGKISIATGGGDIDIGTGLGGNISIMSGLGAVNILANSGGINIGCTSETDTTHKCGHFAVKTVNGLTASQTGTITFTTSGTGILTGPGDFTVSTFDAYRGDVVFQCKGTFKLVTGNTGAVYFDTTNISGSYNWKFPSSMGLSGQVLTSQGYNQVLTWTTPSTAFSGYIEITTGPYVMTNTSPYYTTITSTSGGAIQIFLPDATTLPLGQQYVFNCNGTTPVVIKTFLNPTIVNLGAGSILTVVLTNNTTQNGIWDYHEQLPQNVKWTTAAMTTTSTLTTTNTTDASALNTGALVSLGGLSVSKKIYMGDTLYTNWAGTASGRPSLVCSPGTNDTESSIGFYQNVNATGALYSIGMNISSSGSNTLAIYSSTYTSWIAKFDTSANFTVKNGITANNMTITNQGDTIRFTGGNLHPSGFAVAYNGVNFGANLYMDCNNYLSGAVTSAQGGTFVMSDSTSSNLYTWRGRPAASSTTTDIVALTATGSLLMQGSTASIQLNGSTSGNIVLKSPATPTSYNFILPSTSGTTGQYLTSAAGGTMTWTTGNSAFIAPITMALPSSYNTNVCVMELYEPSAANNSVIEYRVGVSSSYNNTSTIQLNYVSSGSSANYTGIGTFGGNNIFKFYPATQIFMAPIIQATGNSATTPILTVSNTATVSSDLATFYSPNAADNTFQVLQIGKDSSNAGLLYYQFFGAGNASNSIRLKVLGGASEFRVTSTFAFATGQFYTNGTYFANWDQGVSNGSPAIIISPSVAVGEASLAFKSAINNTGITWKIGHNVGSSGGDTCAIYSSTYNSWVAKFENSGLATFRNISISALTATNLTVSNQGEAIRFTGGNLHPSGFLVAYNGINFGARLSMDCNNQMSGSTTSSQGGTFVIDDQGELFTWRARAPGSSTDTTPMTLDKNGQLTMRASNPVIATDADLQINATTNSSRHIRIYAGGYQTGGLYLNSGQNNGDRPSYGSTNIGNINLGNSLFVGNQQENYFGTVSANGIVNIAASNTNNQYITFYDKNSFGNPSSATGSIAANISGGVNYNTTSDYRIKENIVTMPSILPLINQLRPVTFNYVQCTDTSHGFIAHEVQEIYPEAVTGEKDALDEYEKPKLQQLSLSNFTPILTKGIQELYSLLSSQQEIITTLMERITVLEQK